MRSMHAFHWGLSKAKEGSAPASVTGGSWKKSPVTTSCGMCTFSASHRLKDNQGLPVCHQMAGRVPHSASGPQSMTGG